MFVESIGVSVSIYILFTYIELKFDKHFIYRAPSYVVSYLTLLFTIRLARSVIP